MTTSDADRNVSSHCASAHHVNSCGLRHAMRAASETLSPEQHEIRTPTSKRTEESELRVTLARCMSAFSLPSVCWWVHCGGLE